MPSIKFTITQPNGQDESILVEGHRALLGTASHCDVRLPHDQAAPEQLSFRIHANELHVEPRASEPMALFNGRPLVAAAVAPDAVLSIGKLRLFATIHAESNADNRKPISGRWQRGMIQLAAIGLVTVAAVIALNDETRTVAYKGDGEVALFGAPDRNCPYSDSSEALAFAAEQLDLAHGRRERLPFVAKDGLVAAALYRGAAACFQVGGAVALAQEARDTAQSIEQELTDDFRARKIRLGRMLAVEDFELANRDLAILLELTEGLRGAYVDWLHGIAIQLKNKGFR